MTTRAVQYKGKALVSGPRRKRVIADNVFGMIIFLFTELMFFTALVSAFLVIKGDGVTWSIPQGIRLPIMATAYNTAILFLSGIMLLLAGRSTFSLAQKRACVAWATLLGACFVGFQAYEWLQLMSYGLTMNSSIFGACFFLVIGSHAVHVLLGVGIMLYLWYISNKSWDKSNLLTVQMFWLLVVGVWPVLFNLVYF